ncbi:hypothetical protein VTI28DRAFT_2337 [Corynascus sepedonium]|uniref:PLAC8 family-domain-containing protein n=1 Tax=Corynascus novoguineensis TaxID=1126955 RepID=A0AAN7CLR4_9PEZI|nr:PLAC8 family-domain-containing protein [Corynascus novoguineensis]
MAPQKIDAHDWQEENGFCSFCGDGCGTCMLGSFVPCVLINKTQDLIEDPYNKDPSACGAFGCLSCLLSLFGMSFVMGCIQRRSIRVKYGIEGNSCTDFALNGLLPCCAVIQQYRELEIRRDAGQGGYQKQAPMRMP